MGAKPACSHETTCPVKITKKGTGWSCEGRLCIRCHHLDVPEEAKPFLGGTLADGINKKTILTRLTTPLL